MYNIKCYRFIETTCGKSGPMSIKQASENIRGTMKQKTSASSGGENRGEIEWKFGETTVPRQFYEIRHQIYDLRWQILERRSRIMNVITVSCYCNVKCFG